MLYLSTNNLLEMLRVLVLTTRFTITRLICVLLLTLFSSQSMAVVAVSASSSDNDNNPTTLSASHTIAGTDRLLLVGVSIWNSDQSDDFVSSVTYGGTSLTKIGHHFRGNDSRVEIWALLAPTVGTANIIVTFNQQIDDGAGFGAISFTGVHQSSPYGAMATNDADSGTASLTMSSANDELVFAVMASERQDALPTAGTGITNDWRYKWSGNNRLVGAGGTKAGAASVNTSWSLDDSDDWAMAGLSIRPSATGGGGSCVTFRDEFSTESYNRQDGTANWATSWDETGDNDNASNGDIEINNNELRLEGDGSSPSIEREANLSTYNQATLTFNYRTSGNWEPSDSTQIYVSNNGGGSWTLLDTFSNDQTAAIYSRDISSYISNNFRLRFVEGSNQDSERFHFDNVQVEACVTVDTTPPTISGVTGSCPGLNQITVTFSEDVELTTAVNIGNYTLDNGATITGATLTSSNTVTLNTSVLTDLTSYSLTVNNIQDLAGNTIVANSTMAFGVNCSNLIAHYRLDEETWNGTAGEIRDFLGNYNGVAIGVATPLFPGRVCNAAYIPYDNNDADQHAIETGIDVDSVLGNAGAIDFWFQSDTPWQGGEDRVLFDASLGNKYFFLLIQNDGSLRFGLEDSNDGDFRFNTPQYNFSATDWVHIAVTWDLPNDRLEIYVNGNLVASDTSNTNGVLGNMNTLYFGDNRTSYHPGGTANSSHGRIDEIYIYNTVVNQAQIQSDMNATHACAAVACSYRDDFTTASFANDDGSLNWAGNWTEYDTAAAGTGAGYVSVSGGDLVLQNYNPSESTNRPGVVRGFSLSGASNATLSYTYKLTGGVEAIDEAIVEISDDGGASWTTVDTINGLADGVYTNTVQLSSFPAISLTNNMQISLRINSENIVGNGGCCYGGSGETISFTYLSIYPAGMCGVGTVHHYQIDHDGTALTCNPEDITVRACANADCSSLFASPSTVTLDTTPSGTTVAQTFTGSGTFQLQRTTPGAYDLVISSPSPAPVNSQSCNNTAIPSSSCTLAYYDTGFIYSVPDITACQSSASFNIQAVRRDDTSQLCVPAFGNRTASLNLWTTYSNPNTGTEQIQLAHNATNTILATSSPGTPVSLNFDANAQAAVTVYYEDAGQVTLNSSFTGTGTEAGLIMTGSDAFISQPGTMYVYSDDANSDCLSGDASCTVFRKTGQNFNLNVRAACNNGPTYTATPNFRLNNVVLSTTNIAPAINNGNLGVTSINFDAAANGEIVVNNQTLSEVGVFTITATPPALGYFGLTVNPGTSANIGRFTPSHFAISGVPTLTNRSDLPGCLDTFTYMGENLRLAYTLETRNSGNIVTQNYTGGFAILDPTAGFAAFNYGATFNNTDLSSRINSDHTGSSVFTNGVASITNTMQISRAVTLDGQFNPLAIGIAANDGEDTLMGSFDLSLNGGANTHTQTINNADIRYGRFNIENAFGPQTLNLAVTAQTQYYDGTNFVLNTNDNCTVMNSGLMGFDQWTEFLGIGDTQVFSINNPAVVLGSSALILTAPNSLNTTDDNNGSVRITATVPGYLQYDWDGIAGDENPAGIATFGIFRGDDRIIFWREILN